MIFLKWSKGHTNKHKEKQAYLENFDNRDFKWRNYRICLTLNSEKRIIILKFSFLLSFFACLMFKTTYGDDVFPCIGSAAVFCIFTIYAVEKKV